MPKKTNKTTSPIFRRGGYVNRLALVRAITGLSLGRLARILRETYPGLKASASVLSRVERLEVTASPELAATLHNFFGAPVIGELPFLDVHKALLPLLRGETNHA